MDLNRLYSAHQLELMRAAMSHEADERELHNARADHIAERIAYIREQEGAHAAPLLPADAF